jgi:hypothetical protein
MNYEAISIKYYEYVSVFLPLLPNVQITFLLLCIVLLYVAWLAMSYFVTSSHKQHNFWEKK